MPYQLRSGALNNNDEKNDDDDDNYNNNVTEESNGIATSPSTNFLSSTNPTTTISPTTNLVTPTSMRSTGSTINPTTTTQTTTASTLSASQRRQKMISDCQIKRNNLIIKWAEAQEGHDEEMEKKLEKEVDTLNSRIKVLLEAGNTNGVTDQLHSSTSSNSTSLKGFTLPSEMPKFDHRQGENSLTPDLFIELWEQKLRANGIGEIYWTASLYNCIPMSSTNSDVLYWLDTEICKKKLDWSKAKDVFISHFTRIDQREKDFYNFFSAASAQKEDEDTRSYIERRRNLFKRTERNLNSKLRDTDPILIYLFIGGLKNYTLFMQWVRQRFLAPSSSFTNTTDVNNSINKDSFNIFSSWTMAEDALITFDQEVMQDRNTSKIKSTDKSTKKDVIEHKNVGAHSTSNSSPNLKTTLQLLKAKGFQFPCFHCGETSDAQHFIFYNCPKAKSPKTDKGAKAWADFLSKSKELNHD